MKHRLWSLKKKKELSVGRDITQIELAREVGVSQATISRLMKNEIVGEINSETMTGLCRYFECNLSELLVIDWDASGEKEFA